MPSRRLPSAGLSLLIGPNEVSAPPSARRYQSWPTKENGETGFPISPFRTHLRQAFVALAAGRGWPQPPKGPRVTNGLRDPRSLPPSSGRARSMRMDRSHRTSAPVSRHHSPLERGCGTSTKTTSRGTPEAHQQLSPPRETLRSLYSTQCFRLRVTPSFVTETICLAVVTFKRENQASAVDWRDNED